MSKPLVQVGDPLQYFRTTHVASRVLFPLQYTWKWSIHHAQSHDWALESFTFVAAVKSIQEYWLVKNILFDGDIKPFLNNYMYFFLKDGVEPLWEHSSNIDGGVWTWSFTDKSKALTEYLNVVLSVAGGTYADCEHVNCINLTTNKHGGSNIRVWTDTVDETCAKPDVADELDAKLHYRAWTDSKKTSPNHAYVSESVQSTTADGRAGAREKQSPNRSAGATIEHVQDASPRACGRDYGTKYHGRPRGQRGEPGANVTVSTPGDIRTIHAQSATSARRHSKNTNSHAPRHASRV